MHAAYEHAGAALRFVFQAQSAVAQSECPADLQ
jgi:hypothetical protein